MALITCVATCAALALSGCSLARTGASASHRAGSTSSATDVIDFNLDAFSDATMDVTFTVVDSSTLATLFTQSYTNQSPPVSASFSLAPTPVTVSMSVKFHLLAGGALRTGTNTGAGTTLTDASGSFTNFVLPLFVVDNLASPSAIWPVSTIVDASNLTLGSAYTTGATYYLFQTRQAMGSIAYTHDGTDTQLALFPDNTTSIFQFTTAF